MNTLSNIDILEILKNYGITINGIFSKDLLPHTLENGWYIINLQNHNIGNGTHWTCFNYQNNDKCEYWDSFGFCAPEHLAFLLNPYNFNNKEIQDLESSSCGWFCIALIKYVELNKQKAPLTILVKRFSNMFSKKTILNDGILKCFL